MLAGGRMDNALKKVSQVGLNRRAFAVAALVSMGMLPVFPVNAGQNSSPVKLWTVKYQAGAAPFPPESQIVAYIGGETLFLRPKKGPSISIPAAAITTVSSSEKGRYGSASLAEARFAESMLTPDASSCLGFYPCSLAVTISLLLVIPSYPIKSTEHVVHIVWREKGVDKEIVLKLSKSDYSPFLAQLEKATGKPWKNLHTEWTRVRQELKREEPNKMEIQLDRKVRIGNSDLNSGTYQIVLLERPSNHGELYFFPGELVNADELAAVVSVEIAPGENENNAPLVDYNAGENGIATVSTLRTPSRTFRFPLPLGTPVHSGDEESGVK
jgi:hypothetical protein